MRARHGSCYDSRGVSENSLAGADSGVCVEEQRVATFPGPPIVPRLFVGLRVEDRATRSRLAPQALDGFWWGVRRRISARDAFA